MSPEVTPDDRAKRVVDGDGNEIGIADDVEDGTAYVDSDPGMPSDRKTRLDWGSDERSRYPPRNDAIDENTEDETRLRDDY